MAARSDHLGRSDRGAHRGVRRVERDRADRDVDTRSRGARARVVRQRHGGVAPEYGHANAAGAAGGRRAPAGVVVEAGPAPPARAAGRERGRRAGPRARAGAG